MRWVLRRLLWLGPTLVVVTLVTFGALTLALPAPPEERSLPVFFNADPAGVQRLAVRALRAITERRGDAEAAHEQLARLGGAALPFVLPALDSLTPEGRARVVSALRPVGARMGFELDEHWEPSREVLFWIRFWEEHAIDYRPSVARRAVRRVGQRSTALRDTEVRQLDTYALAELIGQMRPVDREGDVDRVRRLSQLASDITSGAGPVLREAASLAQARLVAAQWGEWWGRHRANYMTYDGTERLVAMLRDTRYGAWLSRAVRHDLGRVADGRSAWEVMRERAHVTLPLFLSGLLGAALWALALAAAASHGSRRVVCVARITSLARAAAPAVGLSVAARLALGSASQQPWVGAVVMALAGAPLVLPSPSRGGDAPRADFARTLKAFGVSRARACLTTLRLSSPALVMQLGAQVSTLLTLTFVVEYALGLRGLGPSTIRALGVHDLNWLMAITIMTTLFVGLLQALCELLLVLLDPRARTPVQPAWGGLN